MAKHIFVTGGVSSSLGKGLTASSLGRLLKSRGLRVTMQKLDPYINVDPGTMNPFEHGEVFVTDDGGETDLDLGHYERFIDENLHRDSNATTGSIYQLGDRQANGAATSSGKTVQVIPHITDEIKDRIMRLATDDVDVVITEVGGTVGDIEILPFLEAIRQFRKDVGRDNVVLRPRDARALPRPVGRAEDQADPALRHRAAQPRHPARRDRLPQRPAHLRRAQAQDLHAVRRARWRRSSRASTPVSLYEIPLALHEEGLDDYVCAFARLRRTSRTRLDLAALGGLVERVEAATTPVRIGLIGKYVDLPDAYLSVVEALRHGGFATGPRSSSTGSRPRRSRACSPPAGSRDLDGIVIPGGFGERGIEGKIAAAGYRPGARHPVPRAVPGPAGHGDRLGPQRLRADRANSREFDSVTPHPVIDLMDEQRDVVDMGGTMRLAPIRPSCARGSQVAGRLRRRRRLRAPPPPLRGQQPLPARASKQAGWSARGRSPDDRLVEFIELPGASVLGRDPGPPGVQEPPGPPPPAVPRPGRRRPGPGRRPGAAPARRRSIAPATISQRG